MFYNNPMLYNNIIYKVKVDKIKKVYVDSRYKTNDSVMNSDFELK